MKDKGIFMGGFSGALAKENLKRQWYMPVLIFLLYFITGIFPLLLLGESAGDYAILSLNNANFIYGSFMVYLPIVTACIVLDYLHRPEKAFALHAQPYSRSKLFNTHVIMGWIMIAVPVLITGLIYILLSGSITVTDSNGALETAYSIKDVLVWLGSSISVYTYYYGLSILAGSIVGNTLTQFLGSLVFFDLVPVLIGIQMLYSAICLPGYDEPSGIFYRILLNSAPSSGNFIYFLATEFDESTGMDVHMIAKGWYLLLGLIFIMIGKYACYKGRLEKVGDSIIFTKVEAGVTAVITIIGGAALGAVFGIAGNSEALMFLGALIGAFISFFLVKLILERSVKIFSARNIRILAVSAAVLVLFMASFVFDFFGYSGKVPNEEDIKNVDAAGMLYISDAGYIVDNDETYVKETYQSEDPEFISKVIALHRYVTENKLYEYDAGENVRTCNIRFSYTLDNGKEFRRVFVVCPDDKAIELIDDVLADNEIRESRKIPEDIKKEISSLEVWQESYGNYRQAEVNGKGSKEDIIKLIDAYNKDKDQEKLDSEVLFDNPDPNDDSVMYIGININYNSDKKNQYFDGYVSSLSVYPTASDVNTIKAVDEIMEKYEVQD